MKSLALNIALPGNSVVLLDRIELSISLLA